MKPIQNSLFDFISTHFSPYKASIIDFKSWFDIQNATFKIFLPSYNSIVNFCKLFSNVYHLYHIFPLFSLFYQLINFNNIRNRFQQFKSIHRSQPPVGHRGRAPSQNWSVKSPDKTRSHSPRIPAVFTHRNFIQRFLLHRCLCHMRIRYPETTTMFHFSLLNKDVKMRYTY